MFKVLSRIWIHNDIKAKRSALYDDSCDCDRGSSIVQFQDKHLE